MFLQFTSRDTTGNKLKMLVNTACISRAYEGVWEMYKGNGNTKTSENCVYITLQQGTEFNVMDPIRSVLELIKKSSR